MAGTPIPTVICSTLSAEGSKVALDALAAGAVAVMGKPRLGLRQFLDGSRREMIQTLKAGVARAPVLSGVHALAMNKSVVLGSSTGGTQT